MKSKKNVFWIAVISFLTVLVIRFFSSHGSTDKPVCSPVACVVPKDTSDTINTSCTDEDRLTDRCQDSSVASRFPELSSNDDVGKLARFVETGEMMYIKDLTRADVRLIVSEFVAMVSEPSLADILNHYMGVPYFTSDSLDDPTEYLMNIFDLVRSDVDQPTKRSNIIITDNCSESGAILGTTYSIPRGTHRIFAVFENSSELYELNYISAIWRDLSRNRMKTCKYVLLRANSKYNYVWLELESGWTQGCYQLDIADPIQPSRILATTKFKVH